MHVPEFEVALQASDHAAIEEQWLKLLESRPDDTGLLLQLAGKLIDKNERKRAATLLMTAADAQKGRDQYEKAFELLEAAGQAYPQDKKIYGELLDVLPKAFADVPEIEAVIEAGKTEHDGNVRSYLDYLAV